MADPAPDMLPEQWVEAMIAGAEAPSGTMRRAEILTAIHERASAHFRLAMSAIGRGDLSEAAAQQAKHDAYCEAWYQFYAAPVVGTA